MVILENPRPLCDDLIQRVVEKYIEERHYKVPKPGRVPSSKSSCTTSTQTLNAPTETINESSSEATNSNVLEMISAEVNKNYIQTHFEDDNDSDDDDSESDEEQIVFDFFTFFDFVIYTSVDHYSLWKLFYSMCRYQV